MKTAKTINEKKKRRRYLKQIKSQFQFFLLFSYTSFIQLCNKEKSEFTERRNEIFLGETFLNGNEEKSTKNNQLKRKVDDEDEKVVVLYQKDTQMTYEMIERRRKILFICSF